jgi:signal transduction histidine kinase
LQVTERQLSPYTWWASGRLLHMKGQPEQAIEHLETALRESAESGYSFMPMKAAREIYDIHVQQGRTALALAAHERYHALYVRVNDQSARLKLQLLRTSEELSSAQREAEQHQEMAKTKSRFIAMASHEFRTPLAAIQSSVELLRHYADRMDSSEREKLWDELDGSFTRLKLTMEQVLVLSKSEAGKLPVNLLPTDWWNTTLEIVAEVQRAFGTRNTVNVVCKDLSLRTQTAMLDVSLFRQALGNLVSNACKYSAEGQAVQLDCWRENVHEATSSTNWLVVEVADSGLGIHSNDHERLFALFERGRNTEHISGTGLGLAIVKRAVDAMGGQVGFESELGKGSVFTLRFRL